MSLQDDVQALGITTEVVNAKVTVSLVRIGTPVQAYEVEKGITVGDFKSKYGLTGLTMVANGEILSDGDVITADTQMVTATNKENG